MNILIKTLDANSPAALCRIKSFTTLFPLPNTKVRINDRPGWDDLARAELLVVHRAVHPDDLAIIRLAKQAGKKVWVDVDDDYFNVPKDHYCHGFYDSQEKKELISACLLWADVVTVSNDLLKESFSLPSAITIPCSYPKEILNFRSATQVKDGPLNRKICWRGSQTHRRSLLEAGDEIVSVSKLHPSWEWHFIGDMPWTFIDEIQGKTTVIADGMEPRDLWTYIHALKPSIQIAPLTDNRFTRSRSNMAWMDGLCGDAITIAPDWPHWRVPGVINYKQNEFLYQLHSAMEVVESGGNFNKEIDHAWFHMREYYTFEAVNKIQREILKTLGG